MKTVIPFALCALLFVGCFKSTSSQLTDLKAQVDDLSQRVKSLEDDRLKAEKQLIQQQQAMQAMHEQMRNMEDYFNKLQVGQTTVPR
jgi:septal ring factor EnvC (AmiA/AmiB activator)